MAHDRKPTILALSIVFPIIATVAVVLRFESRRVKRLALEADDWTILVVLVLAIGVTLTVLLDSRLANLGGHQKFASDGRPADLKQATLNGQFVYAFELLISPCVGMNKISVLLLYKRIFVIPTFQKVVWCSIGIVIAWTVAFEFAVAFSCLPVAAQWNPTIEFKCVNQIALFLSSIATDVATNGIILLLPLYNIWKLQMPTRRKLAVMGIFLLGGLVIVTGIIRIHFLQTAYASLKHPLFSDVTYSYAPTLYWAIVECNVGILSACLPTLRPLFESYRLRSTGSKLAGFHTVSRGSTKYADNVRLNAVERGLSDTASNDTFPVDDDLPVAARKYRDDRQQDFGTERHSDGGSV